MFRQTVSSMDALFFFKVDSLALDISIAAIVLALGMSATWANATYLFRHPRLLARSVLARNVITPLLAIALIAIFPFPAPVAITIGVLAATPVPPTLPGSLLKQGGRDCYVFGLLTSQTVLAVITAPLTVRVIGAIFGAKARFPASQVAKLVVLAILVPFGVGIALRHFFFERAEHAGHILGKVGNVVLIVAIIPLLIFAFSALLTLIGEGVLAGLTALVLIGLAAGHLLGGPNEHDRTALAMATASAHPGIAIAIARANSPQYAKLVAGSVVIYLALRAVLTIPYIRWRRRAGLEGSDLQLPAGA